MAFNATAVGRVRAGGSDTNGAFYDSAISGAGTDYSQQDAAQLSVTDIACSNNTTVTSATGGFTAAMIGNAIRITGGGATSGYYFITARTDTNTITVDRTPGTVTNGTGKVGGAAATLQRLLDTNNAVGDKVVAGNVIYVRGSGSNSPVSADYTYTTLLQPVSGAGNALVKVIGENGRPRFDGTSYDLLFYQCTHIWIENVMIKAGAANIGYMSHVSTAATFKNVAFHLNDLNIDGISVNGEVSLQDCEFMSHATAPTLRTGKYAVVVANNALSTKIEGCTMYRMGGGGIKLSASFVANILNNLILNCKEIGIELTSGVSSHSAVEGNTIDGNGSDGLKVANGTVLQMAHIHDNLITNSGGYGINVASGTAAANDLLKHEDFNALWNNTSGDVNGITLSTNDIALGANPYTQANPPTTNWAVGTTVKAEGTPSAFPSALSGIATTSFLDIGGAQREEAGASGGGLKLVGTGGLVG